MLQFTCTGLLWVLFFFSSSEHILMVLGFRNQATLCIGSVLSLLHSETKYDDAVVRHVGFTLSLPLYFQLLKKMITPFRINPSINYVMYQSCRRKQCLNTDLTSGRLGVQIPAETDLSREFIVTAPLLNAPQ